MEVVYEKAFDANEWFVIVNLILLNIIVWIAPKRLSFFEGIGHYMYGIAVGMLFDHTISIRPWDFYDVNDSSAYQWMDALSYMMYGPYSYFIIYLYVKLQIKGFKNIAYILSWVSVAWFMEWVGVHLGLYHFDKGYNMYWSPVIYFATITVQIVYYHALVRRK